VQSVSGMERGEPDLRKLGLCHTEREKRAVLDPYTSGHLLLDQKSQDWKVLEGCLATHRVGIRSVSQ